MKKSLLMISIAFSLSACSSVEVVHVPIKCIGQPVARVGLTQQEFDTISESALSKIVVFAKILRTRIDSQCTLIKKHNEAHNEY